MPGEERSTEGCRRKPGYERKPQVKVGEALQQVVFYGIASRSTARGDPQLAVDRAHMRIDSDQADNEPLGHLRAGQALCQQAQHVHLTRCQVVERGWRRWLQGQTCSPRCAPAMATARS